MDTLLVTPTLGESAEQQDSIRADVRPTLVRSDDDMVIAIPTGLWQDVSKPSPLCGQQVIATNPVDGTSVALTVQDASWSSTYATMPRGAFLALGGSEVDGVLPIEFYFKDAKSIDSSLLPTETAGATDVSWAPTTPKANHAEESETVSGKVASATSVKVEVEAEPATAAAPVVPASSATTEAPVATTTSVQAASVDSKVAAVRITTTTTTTEAPRPTTTAFDSASAASASKASADAAYASSSSASAAAAAASQAAAAEAEKQAAADAAAAASKSSADAAWASSSSAAAAAAKPTTTTEAPAPEPTQDEPSNGGGGQVFTGGYATYYLQNGNAGHCGTVASDDSKVIALPSAMYADGAHCGQQIKITRVDNGATVVATVRDSCPTCVNSECPRGAVFVSES